MTDHPSVRQAEPDDIDRVREVAHDSITSSYALSPDEIDTIVTVAFSEETLTDRLEADSDTLLVADVEDSVAGLVTGTEDAVDWLLVDPAHRGRGAGTALFEETIEELDGEGDAVRATTLAANTEAGQFFQRFDFDRVDDRHAEFGELELIEYVYAPAADATSESDSASSTETGDAVLPTDRDDLDLPDEVETEDGTVVLGAESVPGSEGGFVTTYTDQDRTDGYGYYCVNCESTDVSVGSMDRIECPNCGNTHRPGEEYDASYL